MSLILAIDPGSTLSAFIEWDGENVLRKFIAPNEVKGSFLNKNNGQKHHLFIEKIASYGMAVGETVFETVYWSGIFAEAYGLRNVKRIPRMDVKMHLCHNSRAKDSNIRQALIDRFGPVGTKKNPGPFHGITKDLWAALALAVTAWDNTYGDIN